MLPMQVWFRNIRVFETPTRIRCCADLFPFHSSIPSIHSSIPSIHPSIHSFHPFIHSFIPSIHLSIHPSIHPFIPSIHFNHSFHHYFHHSFHPHLTTKPPPIHYQDKQYSRKVWKLLEHSSPRHGNQQHTGGKLDCLYVGLRRQKTRPLFARACCRWFVTSKPYGVNATIIKFVVVFHCICGCFM